MDAIRVGDLIRWRTPLYIVENGREEEIGTWHHALVIKITTEIFALDEHESSYLTLMLIGVSYSGQKLEVPTDMFFEMGQIQKSVFGEWVYTAGI